MPPHPAIQLIKNDPERFAAQGAIIATWRTYRAARLGPYYRLTCRENCRQRSIYLGRDGPIVDQVRTLLYEAQEIRRLKREHRRNREHFRRTVIEPLENYVRDIFYLYSNGLYLKGWEVRGFSWGGSFRSDAEVPAHLIPKFHLPLPETLAQIHNQALGGTDDFSANRSPSSATSSKNRQCCLQQEDPTDQTTSTHVPDHRPSSPNGAPSLEIPQSVTQNESGRTVDSSAARSPSSPTSPENRHCCLQQEDPTDQTTSTHTPNHQPPPGGTDDFSADRSPLSQASSENRQCCLQQEDLRNRPTSIDVPIQPTASLNRAPTLEIPQSVTQKPPSTPHHKYPLSPISVYQCSLAVSRILSFTWFPLRHSNFPKRGHRPRSPPFLPPSRKQQPKPLSPSLASYQR